MNRRHTNAAFELDGSLISVPWHAAMNSPEQNRLAWVALTLTPGLGPKRILRAAKALPDLSGLFRLSLTELESLNFPAPAAQFLFTGKARTEAERELVRVREQKGADPHL